MVPGPTTSATSTQFRDNRERGGPHHAVNALTPAGRTPLTSAVGQTADALEYRERPGIMVVLTDGEQTRGGSPCDIGKRLHVEAAGPSMSLACG